MYIDSVDLDHSAFHCHLDENNFDIVTSASEYMGLVAWKPVFGGLRTTKAQTSLHTRAV